MEPNVTLEASKERMPETETKPEVVVANWYDDDAIRVVMTNAVVALERWRRMRFGRKYRESSLRNLSQALPATLKQLFSEDDENRPIPQLLTDEELAFVLVSSALVLIYPLFDESQQATMVRAIKKGKLIGVKGEK